MFSAHPGFLRNGEDVNGYIKALQGALSIMQFAAIYPAIAKFANSRIIHHLVGPKPTDKSGAGVILGVSRALFLTPRPFLIL